MFDKQLGVVLSLAYSPDGRRIASSSINPDNTFVVWDAATGTWFKSSRATRATSTDCVTARTAACWPRRAPMAR